MPGRPDHPGGRRCTQILGLQRAHLVLHRIIHVPDAEIAIGLVKDRLAVRLALGVSLAPKNLDFLTRVALDCRHPHPDQGLASSRIPRIYLIVERHACAGGEANILTIGLGLAKREPILVESHQHGKIFLRGRGR